MFLDTREVKTVGKLSKKKCFFRFVKIHFLEACHLFKNSSKVIIFTFVMYLGHRACSLKIYSYLKNISNLLKYAKKYSKITKICPTETFAPWKIIKTFSTSLCF